MPLKLLLNPLIVKTLATTLIPLSLSLLQTRSKKNKFIEDRLYCGYMNGEFTDDEVRVLCADYGIKYPPSIQRMSNDKRSKTLPLGNRD